MCRVMALLAVGPTLRKIDDDMLSQVERMTACILLSPLSLSSSSLSCYLLFLLLSFFWLLLSHYLGLVLLIMLLIARLSPKAAIAIRLGGIIDYKRRSDEDFDEMIDQLSGTFNFYYY